MRRTLGDRDAVRSSVDRGRRGEHDVAHASRPHGLEELQAVADVVAEIEFGARHGYADVSEGREMTHRGDLEALHRIREPPGVGEIRFHEWPPAHGLGMDRKS